MKKILALAVMVLGLAFAVPALAQTTTEASPVFFQGAARANMPMWQAVSTGGNMMFAGQPAEFGAGKFMARGWVMHGGQMYFFAQFACVITLLLVWTVLILLIIILLKKIRNRE